MRRIAIIGGWFLVVGIIGFARFPSRVPVSGPAYSIVDFGAIGGGDASQAGTNATAINAAIQACSTGGYVYVPPCTGGYYVANNIVKVGIPNVTIKGDASMGSNLDWAPTSALIGKGAGNTITVSQSGGSIRGIEFRGSTDQTGSDACLKVLGTAVTVADCHIWSPNIGISMQLPTAAGGEFWIKDVLVEGAVKTAGISASCGNAAISLQHVIMFSQDPQPSYGVVVTSCGELQMNGGCDIINMGTCLAMVPGLNGVKGQYVNAAFISDSLFDSPNGNGVLVQPQADGYCSLLKFTNAWASTLNNGGGTYPANGFTLNGSLSTPPAGVRPISDVTFTNCSSRNFVNHCGWYCKNVYGLDISHCTGSGNFVAIQTYGCVGIMSGNKCGDFSPPPGGAATSGNAAYGILIEKSQIALGNDNLLLGNVVGPIKIIP